MLPEQAITEYKKLYEARYGVVLSDAEASLRANNLVNFYTATLGSEHSSETKEVDSFRNNY